MDMIIIKLCSSKGPAAHPFIVTSVQPAKQHIRTLYSTVEQDEFWPAVFVT